MALTTLGDYEVFVYSLQDRFPDITRSTLTLIRRGQGITVFRPLA
jgi:hypothetical protein